MERHAGSLEIQEELLDLGRAVEGDGGRKLFFSPPDIADEDGLVDKAQREQGLITPDLAVKGWLAIDEIDGKAEFFGKKSA